jgi:hypothetical protein
MIAPAEVRQWPLSEKLALFEILWAELSADPDEIEVPGWHREVLDARQARLEQGRARVLDWEEAKEQIRRARA